MIDDMLGSLPQSQFMGQRAPALSSTRYSPCNTQQKELAAEANVDHWEKQVIETEVFLRWRP
jgi:hypothetical protein